MERLTQPSIDYCKDLCTEEMKTCWCETSYCGDAAIYNKLRAYEDTGLKPEEVKKILDSLIGTIAGNIAEVTGSADVARASEIAKAEAEGRLVILPCKVQGCLYAVEIGKIREVIVNQFFYDGFSIIVDYCYHHFGYVAGIGTFGKTVFLTREEAEAALRGGADG